MKKIMGIGLAGLLITGGIIGYGIGTYLYPTSHDKREVIVRSTPLEETDAVVYGDITADSNELEYADISWLNETLAEFQGPLGWITILAQEKDFGAPYCVDQGENVMAKEVAKQLFIMEYILQDKENDSAFQILSIETGLKETIQNPTSEGILAYLPYETFNEVYRRFFDEDFDMKEAQRGTEDEGGLGEAVYYDNRRPGLNGVRTESMTALDVSYDKTSKQYAANIKIQYSERAAQELGQKTQQAVLRYRIKGDRLILKSFAYQ